MSKARLYNATFVANTAAKVRLYRAQLTGTSLVTPKVRLYRAQLTGSAAVIVNPLSPTTGGPGEVLTITATLLGGGSPDSWTWRRISGPAVTLIGTGATRTLTTPSVFPPSPTPTVLGVVATIGGTASTEVQVNITILPQLSWYWTGSAWAGRRVVPA